MTRPLPTKMEPVCDPRGIEGEVMKRKLFKAGVVAVGLLVAWGVYAQPDSDRRWNRSGDNDRQVWGAPSVDRDTWSDRETDWNRSDAAGQTERGWSNDGESGDGSGDPGVPFDPWGQSGGRYEFRQEGVTDDVRGGLPGETSGADDPVYRFRGDSWSGQGDGQPSDGEAQYRFRPLSEPEQARKGQMPEFRPLEPRPGTSRQPGLYDSMRAPDRRESVEPDAWFER